MHGCGIDKQAFFRLKLDLKCKREEIWFPALHEIDMDKFSITVGN